MSFKWLPAGSDGNSFGGVSVYVKFKKRKGPFREERLFNGFKVHLSDRELFVTRPGYKEYNQFMPVTGYDLCVDADFFGFDTAVNHEALMLTYTNKASKRLYNIKKPDFTIIDSGGFQLLTGASLFIDPIDLAKFANRYGNRCMTLDIPVPVSVTRENLLLSAEIQRNNTQILLDNLNPDIKLYNISHGFNYDERKAFIDVVDRPEVTNWAIGSSYYGNTHDLIYNIFSVLELVEADSYHVFGISNTVLIPLLAWIGKYYNITSDSSSHLQSGINSTVFSINGNRFKKTNVGRVAEELFQSPRLHPHTTCSCNICSAIKTTELFYHSNISSVCHSLAILHNINILENYASIWNDLAQNCDIKEYFKYFKKIISPKERLFWKEALYYIETIVNLGLKKATEKNRGNLSVFQIKTETSEVKSLFIKDVDDEVLDFNKRVEDTAARYVKYYENKEDFVIPKKKIIKKKDRKIYKDKKGKVIKNKRDKSKADIGVSGSSKKTRKKKKKRK